MPCSDRWYVQENPMVASGQVLLRSRPVGKGPVASSEVPWSVSQQPQGRREGSRNCGSPWSRPAGRPELHLGSWEPSREEQPSTIPVYGPLGQEKQADSSAGIALLLKSHLTKGLHQPPSCPSRKPSHQPRELLRPAPNTSSAVALILCRCNCPADMFACLISSQIQHVQKHILGSPSPPIPNLALSLFSLLMVVCTSLE